MAWSPDFGDYWAMITPRDVVQDFAFESSTIIYTVNPGGLVQRLPYTGTSWSTNLPSYDSTICRSHHRSTAGRQSTRWRRTCSRLSRCFLPG